MTTYVSTASALASNNTYTYDTEYTVNLISVTLSGGARNFPQGGGRKDF